MSSETVPTDTSTLDQDLHGIGAVASVTGVSERTLRYYEELELLHPAAHRIGGARRYSDAEIERVQRIRELQELMGFNLEEIRSVLIAEDRLDVLRGQYHAGNEDPVALFEEAISTLESLLKQVGVKRERLAKFSDELDARLKRLRPRLDAERASASDESRERHESTRRKSEGL